MREKTFSSDRPENPFEIIHILDGYCTVLFFDNIEEFEDDEGNKNYKYDLYTLDKVIFRDNLENMISNNLAEWLNKAKEYDYNTHAKEIRTKRDKLLNETDWTQMTDTALSESKKEAYRVYRQELRDVPEQEGFPYDIKWPEEV